MIKSFEKEYFGAHVSSSVCAEKKLRFFSTDDGLGNSNLSHLEPKRIGFSFPTKAIAQETRKLRYKKIIIGFLNLLVITIFCFLLDLT